MKQTAIVRTSLGIVLLVSSQMGCQGMHGQRFDSTLVDTVSYGEAADASTLEDAAVSQNDSLSTDPDWSLAEKAETAASRTRKLTASTAIKTGHAAIKGAVLLTGAIAKSAIHNALGIDRDWQDDR